MTREYRLINEGFASIAEGSTILAPMPIRSSVISVLPKTPLITRILVGCLTKKTFVEVNGTVSVVTVTWGKSRIGGKVLTTERNFCSMRTGLPGRPLRSASRGLDTHIRRFNYPCQTSASATCKELANEPVDMNSDPLASLSIGMSIVPAGKVADAKRQAMWPQRRCSVREPQGGAEGTEAITRFLYL